MHLNISTVESNYFTLQNIASTHVKIRDNKIYYNVRKKVF